MEGSKSIMSITTTADSTSPGSFLPNVPMCLCHRSHFVSAVAMTHCQHHADSHLHDPTTFDPDASSLARVEKCTPRMQQWRHNHDHCAEAVTDSDLGVISEWYFLTMGVVLMSASVSPSR